MASSVSANNIGAFLNTVNLGNEGKSSSVGLDLEAMGKQVMNALAERGEATVLDLGRVLSAPADEVSRAVDYLSAHEMIVTEPVNDTTLVRLTPFARGAMEVFKVR